MVYYTRRISPGDPISPMRIYIRILYHFIYTHYNGDLTSPGGLSPMHMIIKIMSLIMIGIMMIIRNTTIVLMIVTKTEIMIDNVDILNFARRYRLAITHRLSGNTIRFKSWRPM